MAPSRDNATISVAMSGGNMKSLRPLLLNSRNNRPPASVAMATLARGLLFLEFKSSGRSDFMFPPLMATLIVALSRDGAIDRWLQIRPLTYLGRISYSVYMV